ncbi:hypothetical protein [Larsenimonas rhizosphaerae]|uniref:hypothetical protein n=1 Tax=Larsenimonas rhizosphaerae TaxID=2944682 RepID=UPI0020342172|nr:hypothetical protein [Larsenimonas rhizosphaerae]MCM2131960.1 hypothetical protein [Larsenimonas rhizosphaerae]
MSLDEARDRINLLRHFDYSLKLFENNYQELLSVIDFLCDEKVGLELFSVINRWKLNEVLFHLGFKLHNYVCAAKSLIDHARVLYRRVYEEKVLKFKDYEEEVRARFEKDALSKFVEFLRSYCQHEKLPFINASMEFDSQSEEGFVFNVYLDSSELLKSSSIKSLPKSFIKQKGDNINLRNVVNDYHFKVTDFYRWVKIKQQEIHNEDFELLRICFKDEQVRAISNFISSYYDSKGTSSIKEQFYTILSEDNYKELEQYKENETKWLECAIELIESNVVLPEGIKADLKARVNVAVKK